MAIASHKKPRTVAADLWDEMSADARYQAHKDATKKWWQVSILYACAIAPALAFVLVPPVQDLVNKHLPPSHYVKLKGRADPRKFLDESTPKVGETVQGFKITSEYGPRVHPITMEYSQHRGVDVGTPTGTPLYAPAVGTDKVKVQCWEDAKGGGLVAEIGSASITEYRFKALHLDTCKDGSYESGEQFATTGNSGDSTGEHLDWQQLQPGTDVRVEPQRGYLEWVLSGNAGSLEAVDINALMSAIALQESGGNASALNPHSAATGKYQIMPFNIEGTGTGWDYEALGRDISVNELLGDEDLQDAIASHQLEQIATTQATDNAGNARDSVEIAKRTAAVWYSGDPNACSSTRPQFYGAGEYPSIAEYCDSVGKKFTMQQHRLKELD